jgi:hypothetical protein
MFEPVCVITEADESLLGVEDKDPAARKDRLLVTMLEFAPELLVPLRGVRGVFMGSSILS